MTIEEMEAVTERYIISRSIRDVRNKVLFVTVIDLIALDVHMTTCCGSPCVAVK